MRSSVFAQIVVAIVAWTACTAPGTAWAADPWYVGRMVGAVEVRSPQGAMNEGDDLLALLEVHQFDTWNRLTVAHDVATLMQVGQFEAVEAEARPCFAYDRDGNEVDPAACLTYKVFPAPRVERLLVQGNRAVRTREIEVASRVVEGGAFFYDPLAEDPGTQDDEVARQNVIDFLREKGFPQAVVEVDVQPVLTSEERRSGVRLPALFRGSEGLVGRGIEVWIRVAEGPPVELASLSFTSAAGPLKVPEAKLRHWARRGGLAEGKVVPKGALTRARFKIRQELAFLRRWSILPTRRERGWLEARVEHEVTDDPTGLAVRFDIDFGPQVRIDTRICRAEQPEDALPGKLCPAGRNRVVSDLSARRATLDGLGIDARTRLTRGWFEEAPDRLVTWLRARGYHHSRAAVWREPIDEDTVRLVVRVARGHPYRRTHVRFGIDGPDRSEDRHRRTEVSRSDLRRVLRQASPDVLGRGRVTEEAVQSALPAVRALYGSRGIANVGIDGIRIDKDVRDPDEPWLVRATAHAWEALVGIVARPLGLAMHVTEGPVTMLRSLAVVGAVGPDPEPPASKGIDLAPYLARVWETDKPPDGGIPLPPQRIEQMRRELVAEHRRLGYLDVGAVVRVAKLTDGVAATVEVTPGPRVRLRGLVIRGNRRVPTGQIRDVLDLDAGSTVLGSDRLDLLRRSLYDLRMFRLVALEVIGEGAARDLLVTVDEYPRFHVELGVGAATDQGLRAFARPIVRNYLLRRTVVDGLFSVGLNWASGALTNWSLSPRPDWRAALDITAPRFPFRREDLRLELIGRRELRQRQWDMLAAGAGTVLTHRLDGRGRFRVQFRAEAEWRRLADVDPGLVLPEEPWARLLDDSAARTATVDRYHDAVSATFVADLRDDPVHPRAGAQISVATEASPNLSRFFVGPTPRSTPYAYLEAEARVSGWIPMRGLTLRIVSDARHTWPLSKQDGVRHTVPLEDRYRLGGTGSLRGFARESLGPRRLTSVPEVGWSRSLAPVTERWLACDGQDDSCARDQRWVAVGGDTKTSLSLELIIPFPALGAFGWEGYDLAFFTDIGNTWLLGSGRAALAPGAIDPPCEADPACVSPPYASFGVGLRVATPVGPLQADLALAPQTWGFARRALGGEPLPWKQRPISLHLSLGSLL